ncbi:MAG: ABC transporter substrate-binding protein, partial [Phyllobacterium sp.]
MFKNRLLAVASALVLLSYPAVAQTVLTANIEPATTWVRNFNPFNQTSSRQSTLDFIYEPLVIFNRFDNNKPNFRLAESFKLADDLKS